MISFVPLSARPTQASCALPPNPPPSTQHLAQAPPPPTTTHRPHAGLPLRSTAARHACSPHEESPLVVQAGELVHVARQVRRHTPHLLLRLAPPSRLGRTQPLQVRKRQLRPADAGKRPQARP